jgi:hypothetical protein
MIEEQKQTLEQYETTTRELTKKELEKLHKEYKNTLNKKDSSDSDSSEYTNNEDSDEEIHKPKYLLKNISDSNSKQTTMLYMFKKYEMLQYESNMYKNKLYKMRIKIHKEEQKNHYKNLDYSNLKLEIEKLQDELKIIKPLYVKYYISILINLFLSGFLIYLSKGIF